MAKSVIEQVLRRLRGTRAIRRGWRRLNDHRRQPDWSALGAPPAAIERGLQAMIAGMEADTGLRIIVTERPYDLDAIRGGTTSTTDENAGHRGESEAA